jgi:cytochrome c biogenesis protein CcdA
LILFLGFTAGVLSILSPCVLPLIPIVMAGAMDRDRLGPLALIGGLAFSFTATGLLFAAFGLSLGVGKETVRIIAGVIMVAAGGLLLVNQLQRRFVIFAEPLFNRLQTFIGKFHAQGLAGQAALGALLGVAWSPCAGPTLGAAIGLSIQNGSLLGASAVMFAFALGAVTPLLFFAYAGGHALARRKSLASVARYAKPALGLFLLIIGISIVTGFEKTAETFATKAMPAWLVDLTTRF